MIAARIHGTRDVRLDEVAQPEPGGDELLVRVLSVGLCGSDLHYYAESGIGAVKVAEPAILGHEFAAEVVDERAEEFGLIRGQLVAVDPALPCFSCEWCLRGHHNLCPNVRFAGAPPYPGGLAEYFTAPRHLLFPVPDTFTADETALLEPLGVAIHALDLARLKPLESVAILGAGPIGLLLLQVARQVGAGDIYVIDPLAYRAEKAKELGADEVSTGLGSIQTWTKERGVDVVLEATNSPEGVQHAIEAVRIGGRIVLVGIPDGDTNTFTASHARRKGLTIKYSRRMNHVYPRAIDLLRKGLVNLSTLVTHRFLLSQTDEAFALQASYEDGVIKTVVYQEAHQEDEPM